MGKNDLLQLRIEPATFALADFVADFFQVALGDVFDLLNVVWGRILVQTHALVARTVRPRELRLEVLGLVVLGTTKLGRLQKAEGVVPRRVTKQPDNV